LFDSGILLIIDLNKKKGKKGGGVNFICELHMGCDDESVLKIAIQ
jgi:hypothetical protein